jgi:hypothetical protein
MEMGGVLNHFVVCVGLTLFEEIDAGLANRLLGGGVAVCV